jgi:hypothetical protein
MFYDGTTLLGVGPFFPVGSGVATLKTPLLAAGTHTLTARYLAGC